ncbi:hypothetical protein K1719_029831 [Acacia pycnantha]|nr:hypothetical protein K1719_029831 [Acacia pycnantha]
MHVYYPPSRYNSAPAALSNANSSKEKTIDAKSRSASAPFVSGTPISSEKTNGLKCQKVDAPKSADSIAEMEEENLPSIEETCLQTPSQAPLNSPTQVLKPPPPPPPPLPPPPLFHPKNSMAYAFETSSVSRQNQEMDLQPTTSPPPPPPPPPFFTNRTITSEVLECLM